MRSDCTACYDSTNSKNDDCSDISGFILPLNTQQSESSNYLINPIKLSDSPIITNEGTENIIVKIYNSLFINFNNDKP